MRNVRATYDEEANALYVYLREGEPFGYTDCVHPDLNVDYGKDGFPSGVEVLNVLPRALPLTATNATPILLTATNKGVT